MWVVPMNKISHNARQTTGMNVTVDPHTDLSLLKPLPTRLRFKTNKQTKKNGYQKDIKLQQNLQIVYIYISGQ